MGKNIISEINDTRLAVLYNWVNFEKVNKLATHDNLNRILCGIQHHVFLNLKHISLENQEKLLILLPLIREYISTITTTTTTATITTLRSKSPTTTSTKTIPNCKRKYPS